MKILLIFLFFKIPFILKPQQYLSNGGFESGVLPGSTGDFYFSMGWGNMEGEGTPDYLHQDGDYPVQLPNNSEFGVIYPHGGKAVMGLVAYHQPNNDLNEFREYISTQLNAPLTIGTEYELSFWVTSGSISFTGGGCNNLGAVLTTTPLIQQVFSSVATNPQFVIQDTLYTHDWVEYKFTFIADSAYNYLGLGNFFNNSETYAAVFDTVNVFHYPSLTSYYFLDDISLKTPVNEPNHSIDSIVMVENFPNSFTPNGDGINDYFTFQFPNNFSDISFIIINRWGDIILNSDDLTLLWDGKYKTKECNSGCYFWIMNYKDKKGKEHTLNGFINLYR